MCEHDRDPYTYCKVGRKRTAYGICPKYSEVPDPPDETPDETPGETPDITRDQVGGDHYRSLNPEPIDVIQAWDLNFCLGNVVKYIARAGRKDGNTKEKDLKKAIQYIKFELEK
jgi:hypothetical protein